MAQDFSGEHTAICPEAAVPCPSESLGCTVSVPRRSIWEHTTNCAFVLLGPYLIKQAERLDALDSENKSLKRKFDSLLTTSDGITIPFTDLGTAFPTSSSALIPNSPFESPTQHLLSLHEDLRANVDKLSTTIAELEARQNLLLTNENLRTREELAGVRGAIGTLRAQVYWLVNHSVRGPASSGGSAANHSNTTHASNAVAGPSASSGGSSISTISSLGSAVRRLSGMHLHGLIFDPC